MSANAYNGDSIRGINGWWGGGYTHGSGVGRKGEGRWLRRGIRGTRGYTEMQCGGEGGEEGRMGYIYEDKVKSNTWIFVLCLAGTDDSLRFTSSDPGISP